MGRVSMLLADRLTPTGTRPAPSTEFIAKVLDEGRRHTIQLLRDIAGVVENERAELRVDYFAMHNAVWKLLQEIRKDIVDTFGADVAPLPEVKDLPFVVGYVFAAASGRKGIQETGQPIDDLINIAADVVARFLKNGKGHKVKDWLEIEDFDEVDGLEFEDKYPCGMNRLVKELRKKGASPQIDGQCPVQ
ncbi:unnamed protein product [Clonostachys rosea]|uniref:Uncharacterized protein n=1 Tax=Bionectria ochroleuca TaxID=29856 RepID=A0ABY6UAD2_BIOOC|nr:unnamed protein product [Clonostachys rosea]